MGSEEIAYRPLSQRCKHCGHEIVKSLDGDGEWVHIQRGVVPNPNYLHRTCIFPRTHAEPRTLPAEMLGTSPDA